MDYKVSTKEIMSNDTQRIDQFWHHMFIDMKYSATHQPGPMDTFTSREAAEFDIRKRLSEIYNCPQDQIMIDWQDRSDKRTGRVEFFTYDGSYGFAVLMFQTQLQTSGKVTIN